ncbi:PLAC8 family-domain-containing protein [Mrakia frigida]|uniref:PLAC8 family protein n=1 Tax=Mrakia frigida TaxID=29902 RepID=UPI003FCC03E8
MSKYPPQYSSYPQSPQHHHYHHQQQQQHHQHAPQPLHHYDNRRPYPQQQGQPQRYQTSQPTLKANMNRRGDPRNPAGASLTGSRGRREWTHGLCGCCSRPGICCYSCCCPCIVFSKNKSRLHHLDRYNTKHPKRGDSCSGDCFLHCCLTSFLGLGWILQIGSRGDTRDHYRIEGGCCGDCMANWCCSPCALTQEAREIELEENFQGDNHALLSGV